MVRQLIASDGFGVGLGFVARYLEERDRMVDDRLWPNQWVDVLQIPKFSRQSSQYHHTSHHSPRISVAIHRIPLFFGDKEAWFPFFSQSINPLSFAFAKESGSHHVCHAHRCEALHGPLAASCRRWICPKWGTENFVMLMEENAKLVDKQPWFSVHCKKTHGFDYILSLDFFCNFLKPSDSLNFPKVLWKHSLKVRVCCRKFVGLRRRMRARSWMASMIPVCWANAPRTHRTPGTGGGIHTIP